MAPGRRAGHAAAAWRRPSAGRRSRIGLFTNERRPAAGSDVMPATAPQTETTVMDTNTTPRTAAEAHAAEHGAITHDLPPAASGTSRTPERIMQLGFGFWGAKTLLSAVEL